MVVTHHSRSRRSGIWNLDVSSLDSVIAIVGGETDSTEEEMEAGEVVRFTIRGQMGAACDLRNSGWSRR